MAERRLYDYTSDYTSDYTVLRMRAHYTALIQSRYGFSVSLYFPN